MSLEDSTIQAQKIWPTFTELLYHNLYKMFTADVEFNELSSAVYRKEILHLELKILGKYSFHCVICVHLVNFCRLSH